MASAAVTRPLSEISTAATPAQRAAAERLGAVYLHIAASRDMPLGAWAIPSEATTSMRPSLMAALSAVHGTDNEQARRRRRPDYESKRMLYTNDYSAVMPRVGRATRVWAWATLVSEESALDRLLFTVERGPGVPETLHELAATVGSKTGGFDATAPAFRDAYESVIPAPAFPRFDPKTGKTQMVPAGQDARLNLDWKRMNPVIMRRRVAKAVREQQHELLSTLFAHPSGVAILAEYAKDAKAGTRLAVGLITEARESVVAFRDTLTESGNDAHCWRYATLVSGGVAVLGLHQVPGFKEYAVATGRILGQDTPAGRAERVVGFAGMAVLCLGLVFGGPLGLVVLGAGDLALAGAGAGLAYLREREQELAAGASGFRGDDDKFAASSGYLDTTLAGAAGLLPRSLSSRGSGSSGN